jgi:hypothetical protein
MKKLSIVAAILFAFATVSFAQDKAAAPAKSDKKAAKTDKKAAKSDKKMDKKADAKATK